MAARLVQVTLVNNSDHPIAWLDDQRPHGFWQEPWYPSNIKNLTKGQSASWRLESGGVATGVEGRAWFKVDIGHGQTEFLDFWWERPYIGKFDRTATCTRHDPRTNDPDHIGPFVVYAKDLGFSGSNDDQSPFEFLLGIPTIPVVGNVPSTIILLNNDTNATQVAWVVEVLNVGESSKLRLQAAVQEQCRASFTPSWTTATCFGIATTVGATAASHGRPTRVRRSATGGSPNRCSRAERSPWHQRD